MVEMHEFVPHAIASTFFIINSPIAATAAAKAPKIKVVCAPWLCHSTPAMTPENIDANPTAP
jgi:hypothetical protein